MMTAEPSLDAAQTPPSAYAFWTPPAGATVAVGAERQPFPLPSIPLPLHPAALAAGDPDDAAIGQGLYDYLRQFPDCLHNRAYAELLRDAYPHFLADLGSQILLLENKDVAGHYVRRKLAYLKILALLEPENVGLLQSIGITCYDLGMTFSEFGQARQHLLGALRFLQRAQRLEPASGYLTNYLAQTNYLLGDFPQALTLWRQLAPELPEGPAKTALLKKLADLEQGAVPDHPPVDDLERVGLAMSCYGNREPAAACEILERLEEEGTMLREFPTPDFYYFLGICRSQCGDAAGAFAALEQGLELDPEHEPSLQARERLLEGNPL
jgi:tetratricopeptide (TPR) repeat protein